MGNQFCNIYISVLISEHTRRQILFCNRIVKEPQRAGRQKVISKCISIGRIKGDMDFSMLYLWRLIVRRTISFYNKEELFFLLEKELWSFKCLLCGLLTIELFMFFCLLYKSVRSFLLMNYFYVMNDFLLFYEAYVANWVMNVLINIELPLRISFCCIHVFWILSATFDILYAYFTVHWSHK